MSTEGKVRLVHVASALDDALVDENLGDMSSVASGVSRTSVLGCGK
jgi:hypothetical protein